MFLRVFISRICLYLANSFCFVSQVQTFFFFFFFLSIQLKILEKFWVLQTHISVTEVSYILIPDKWSHVLFKSIWTAAVKIAISICFLELVISLSLSTVSYFSTLTNALVVLYSSLSYTKINTNRLIPPFGLWAQFPSSPLQFTYIYFQFFIFLSTHICKEVPVNMFANCLAI